MVVVVVVRIVGYYNEFTYLVFPSNSYCRDIPTEMSHEISKCNSLCRTISILWCTDLILKEESELLVTASWAGKIMLLGEIHQYGSLNWYDNKRRRRDVDACVCMHVSALCSLSSSRFLSVFMSKTLFFLCVIKQASDQNSASIKSVTLSLSFSIDIRFSVSHCDFLSIPFLSIYRPSSSSLSDNNPYTYLSNQKCTLSPLHSPFLRLVWCLMLSRLIFMSKLR